MQAQFHEQLSLKRLRLSRSRLSPSPNGAIRIPLTPCTSTALLTSMFSQAAQPRKTPSFSVAAVVDSKQCHSYPTYAMHLDCAPLRLGHGLRPMTINIKKLRSMQAWAKLFHIYRRMAHCHREYYLFENCGARRAAFKPYFFLSFILGSLVKKPFFLSTGRKSASALQSALAMP